MFLILIAILMKFIENTKAKRQSQRSQGVVDNSAGNKVAWHHVAMAHKAEHHSNSSSTSSGCDSNTSSSSLKENCCHVEQNHTITPQQLQQIRHCQRLQQQQLQLLQKQLLQRRHLQEQLRAEGVVLGGGGDQRKSSSSSLTCNQQYLEQSRQPNYNNQQHHVFFNDNDNYQHNYYQTLFNLNNNKNVNLNNVNNTSSVNNKSSNHSNNKNNDHNNNNNNNRYSINNNISKKLSFDLQGEIAKGQKSRRGMTEFSTNNDISHNSHHSQPLHTSPLHQSHNRHNHYQQQHNNSPQHHSHQAFHHPLSNINNHLTFKQTQNHKNNQETLTLNSSANINNCSAVTSPSSATHSPLHYKKPLNSPNNSPFAYAYYGAHQLQHHQQQQQQHHLPATTTAGTAATRQQQLQQHQQQQQQQHLWLLNNNLSQTNYQQHLNDLLLQQQHLQQQQQHLLNAAGAKDDCIHGGDELSDECLKQNVAIVLSNLDRYNNALRSIILNEQVSNSLFDDSVLDFSSISSSKSNNNFVLSTDSKMATTPESDYNSNATTPGSRVGRNMLPTQQHLMQHHQQQQQQQHDNVVGFATAATACGVGIGNLRGGGGGGWDTIGDGFCSNVGGGGGGGGGGGVISNNLNCSLASSHDFTHDNSDYQWFLDYGYRDGCGMQRSVLSSLSASYNGIGELLYYDDMAKNIDANLAEVDMESFRAEDIHSLLSQLPSYCKGLGGGSGGINAKLQHSLMQQHMLPAHNMSQTSTSSTNELIDNSICKSELLFSPVKESHISVDSLDLDSYPDDGDIILTCKANKDNYTIAFEGSVLYSDESFYAEPSEIMLKNKQNFINLHSNLDDIVKRKSMEVSMSRSEQQLTTWSKLKKGSTLHRYPSGNNNTAENVASALHAPHGAVRKSSSLPNLRSKKDMSSYSRQQLNVSHVSTSILDSCRLRNLLPMCQMPISCGSTAASTSERLTQNSQRQQQQQSQLQPQQLQMQHNHQQQHHNQHHHHHQHHHHQSQLQAHDSSSSVASASSTTLQKNHNGNGNTSSGTSAASSNLPAFNLVKLFIKQKSSSISIEDHATAHTCMDVSSGCWPSSDAAGSSGSSSSLEQRLRKKSMNDSGKGSALSRHDEEELCCNVGVGESYVVDAGGGARDADKHARCNNDVFYDEERTLTVAQRRRSLPMRHPHVSHLAQQQHQQTNNNNGSSVGSLNSSDPSRSNSEQLTQVYLSADGESCPSSERKKAVHRREKSNFNRSRESTTSEMITRSMQTSCGALSTRSSLNDRFRLVPPSFLAKLNNLGEEKQAPIYVIYPNYALPDLGFVKTANTPDIIFSPFNFKASISGDVSTAFQKHRFSEDEVLKNMDYKHVIDWKSLATLLPAEYRKRLQHIPEVGSLNLEQGSEVSSQKPLFCLSPPIRRPHRAMHLCDCAQFFQPATQTQREGSSSSGSSQQPSSGYRGSSTLLTDSEMGDTAAGAPTPPDPLKQMFVYQYEQQQQQQRMDTDVNMPAAIPANKPTPQPRGILRKTTSQTRNKRNSMIEEHQTKLTKKEKRRSLQEPAYNHRLTSGGSMDELYDALPEEEVFEEHLVEAYVAGKPQTNQRLSRKDLDARARAENFLSSVPRAELKYYAEIAAILESSEDQQQAAVQYDAAALKKEVSRALSQQKKVSFNENDQLLQHQPYNHQLQQQQQLLQGDIRQKRFSTPPNSPNISIAGGLRMPPNSYPRTVTRRCSHLDTQVAARNSTIDSKEQLKATSNRFKRLQIQWELLSKDSSMMLKDLACEQETKSGGSTPTSAQAAAAAAAQRSRIPRPVSYPAGKPVIKSNPEPVSQKPIEKRGCAKIVKPVISPRIGRVTNQDIPKSSMTRSPSRIVPPKRYSISSPVAASGVASTPTTPSPTVSRVTTPTSGVTTRARTPISRAASATAPNTPKRRVQSPRTIPRLR